MAGTPGSSKWSLSNWTAGPVTLFEALGIKKGTISYPQLSTQLPGSSNNSSSTSSSTTSSSGSTSSAVATGPCSAAQTQSNQKLGQQMAAALGWTGSEWAALNSLVMNESGWCNTIQNPDSTAYGIGQFLNTTWASTGYTKTSSPQTQIAAMLLYIKNTYGSPSAAWQFEQDNGYY